MNDSAFGSFNFRIFTNGLHAINSKLKYSYVHATISCIIEVVQFGVVDQFEWHIYYTQTHNKKFVCKFRCHLQIYA